MTETSKQSGEACARMAAALTEMLQTTPIERIVIKQLCQRATVNRSTFYRYYADQYALLNQVWCDLTQQYLDCVYQPVFSDLEALTKLLCFAQENRVIVTAVFRLVVLGCPLPDYADFVRVTLVDHVSKEKAPYLQTVLVAMIYSWLMKKTPEPAAFIAQLMMDVARNLQ